VSRTFFIFVKNSLRKVAFGSILLFSFLTACLRAGVAEKTARIPGHAWDSSFSPSFDFTVTDTVSRYRLYVVIRHTDAYRYKNLWVQIGVNVPGEPFRTERKNLLLGTDEKGWLGKGMDDIYEQRILLNTIPFPFRKAGVYTYTLRHLMREDPLDHVMNAGIRIEKVIE
jgi:gliding motility-associated lipoprotein GldH